MSNKEEKKICKESMALALVQLCETKPFSEISISEICEKAGVSRMAFYRNFKSKEDIFKSYFESILNDFFISLNINGKPGPFLNYHNLVFTFNYFKEYSSFINCLRSVHAGDIMLNNIISYELKKHYVNDDKSKFYTLIAYAGSIYSVYISWLSNNFLDSTEDIANYIYEIYKNV